MLYNIEVNSINGERALITITKDNAILTMEVSKFATLNSIMEEFDSTISLSLSMEEH